MNVPPVSVLLPVHNGAATLPNALRSLSWQTLAGWELVVADDGSTDGSRDVVRGLGHPRLVLLELPRRGLVATLNAGLEACRGPLVARMDADDLCRPDRLERQVAFLEAHPEVAVAGCLVRMFPSRTLTPGMRRYEAWLNSLVEPGEIERDLLVESPLVHPSVVFRKEAVAAVGGYRPGDWPEDYDLWLRMAEAGFRFAKVPQTLFFWRDWPGRITRTDPRCHPDRFRELKVEALLRTRLADPGPTLIWGAGPSGRRLARELARRGRPATGLVDDHPGRQGQRIAGLEVVHPGDLPPRGEALVLVAVGRPQGRAAIRRHLAGLGWVEGRDFLCVA